MVWTPHGTQLTQFVFRSLDDSYVLPESGTVTVKIV